MKKVFAILMLVSSSAFANFNCGIPPIPPIGCQVGPCVCDENGDNCHYVMIC
jgi:hypothetical protein